jgi:hypothetical protein
MIYHGSLRTEKKNFKVVMLTPIVAMVYPIYHPTMAVGAGLFTMLLIIVLSRYRRRKVTA